MQKAGCPAEVIGGAAELLICLTAQEGRNIELIVGRRIVHRRGAAVGVETLRRGPAGVFGNRIVFKDTSPWTGAEERKRPHRTSN